MKSGNVKEMAELVKSQLDSSFDLKTLEWVRSLWPGKLVVKGIMDVDDAKLAIGAGADAILVSNHGGRQLDGAPSTASILAGIVDAVGDKAEVYVDSGVRSGLDVPEVPRARRPRLLHRPCLPLWPRRVRPGRCDQGAGDFEG